MAITDYKITDNEINTYNVKSAPDTLKSNAQSNKNWFDRLGEYFISKYNSLLDFIQGDFVNVDEVGAGLTYENNLEWKHALHKNAMIANYSGNITAITTGYRTIIANVTGLTTEDFMDCIMNINGTDYQCADAYESGDFVTTTCDVEGVEVTITYSLSGGDITLTHAQNPLDTLYWNIQMFSTVAEKVPRKALPASVSNDGYTELKNLIVKATTSFIVTEHNVTFEYWSVVRKCRGTFDPPAGYTLESGDRYELYLNGLRISDDQYEVGTYGNKIAILINFGTDVDPIPNEDTVYQDVTVVIRKAVG